MALQSPAPDPRVERRSGRRDQELGADSPRELGDPEAPAVSPRALLSRSGIRGTAVEMAWLSTHVVTYPLGLLREKRQIAVQKLSLDHLGPKQRGLMINDIEAAGTPIVLIHGVIDNRSVFTFLRRSLRRRGFGRIVTVNYSPLSDDIRAVAKRLADTIEAVVHETGYERVHVVGHSLGGLIGRYYVQQMGGDARVHTLVTLGSPHAGTLPATWVPHPIARQMRPDSDIVSGFGSPAPHCRTRFVSVWSDLDLMISPKRSARMVHPDLNIRNVFVPGVGHLSLPVDGRVVHEVCTTLAHLDADGHARTAQVVPSP